MNLKTEYLGCKFEASKNVVFFHHPCQDGFSAAWVAYLHLGTLNTCYWGTTYTDEFWDDDIAVDYSIFAGKDIYIVDFSFPVDELAELASIANSVTVCDHHVKFKRLLKVHPIFPAAKVSGTFDEPHDAPTAAEKLPTNMTRVQLDDNLTIYFHDYRCGAQVTADALSQIDSLGPAPDVVISYPAVQHMLTLIGDRDLWYWLEPNSRDLHRVLALEERTFKAWTDFAIKYSKVEGERELVQTGTILGEAEKVQISSYVRRAKLMDFPGQDVQIPVANVANMISEVGQALLEEYPDAPFSATFFYPDPGKRVWSLRARKGDDVDVCAVAAEFGGGGHRKAAGFHTRIGFCIA